MNDLVGVSLRVVETPTYTELRDAISHDWIRLLSHYGVTPLLIPNTLPNLRAFLDQMPLTALLLTNGNDVGCLDGDEARPSVSDASEERDTAERTMIEFAVEHRTPVLGVCRGMQMLNAYFGGKLARDLTEPCGSSDAHVATQHSIEIVDPRWRHRLGASSASTNSFHRHAVTVSALSPQLLPMAMADRGIVEGMYHPDLPIIGLQWHPERANSAAELDLILIETWLGRR